MNSLQKFIKDMESKLDLTEEELKDFREAADHNMQCTCKKCKRYWEIMKIK